MTGGNDGNIETAIPKRVFNEALYQLVVLDNEDKRQFHSFSPNPCQELLQSARKEP